MEAGDADPASMILQKLSCFCIDITVGKDVASSDPEKWSFNESEAQIPDRQHRQEAKAGSSQRYVEVREVQEVSVDCHGKLPHDEEVKKVDRVGILSEQCDRLRHTTSAMRERVVIPGYGDSARDPFQRGNDDPKRVKQRIHLATSESSPRIEEPVEEGQEEDSADAQQMSTPDGVVELIGSHPIVEPESGRTTGRSPAVAG